VSPPREPTTRDGVDRERPPAAGRLVARKRPPAEARVPERADLQPPNPPSATEVAALRARLLRFALTLPGVALGDSRLDLGAAGLFHRVLIEDGAGVVAREFATLRNRPRWSFSVVLPVDAAAELQRLGWGRPRQATASAQALVVELARPRHDADLAPLGRALVIGHRAAAEGQGRNR
jgi:hypothetical protein